MEQGHMSVRRGMSWSPGGLREPFSVMQTPGTECTASWEDNKEQMSLKTSLTRSASLSEKELKEARVRSQIIAAQLTVPTSTSSRGVQLFNRRRQRVNAFTLESSGEGLEEDRADNVKSNPSTKKLVWSERRTEEKDSGLNFKNSGAEQLLPQPGRARSLGDSSSSPGKVSHMEEEPADHINEERHFLPVKEEQEEEDDEEEEERDNVPQELKVKVKEENPPGSNEAGGRDEINGSHVGSALRGKLLNGCPCTSEPERMSMSTSKQTSTIINRTARPFFSPLTVQSPGATSPVMGVPPAPSYASPPLPAFNISQTVAFSPPPPPPSYPTPPLPSLPRQLPQSNPSSPPPMSPVALPSHFPSPVDSQFPTMPSRGPPTAPKPSTFVPQHIVEMKPTASVKTGILEESAARRSNKKAMFTFKEKPIVSPNPELLSLVQGVDEKKKNLNRSVPEPTPEEELLALGAEASNFLAKEADKVEEAKAPEWASCLKSSRTRPRTEHGPEQTLSNVSGKGAELFAKRQSRMEKYVVEKKNEGQIRSPSPTMSLPPSWVYPSNMPGRVKAIVKNSDMSTQLTQNLKAQQAVKQMPRQKTKAPEPIPEPPPLENGCSKIEMDLARHQPYQLDSSLFIIKPVRDPLCTLPRSAPKSKNVTSSQYFSRQASLPTNPQSHFRSQSKPRQMLLVPASGGAEYLSSPDPCQPRSSSSMAAFSPDRVSSPHSGVQAPRPTFSAKKAGIAAQISKESSLLETQSENPISTTTRTPGLNRCFSSPGAAETGTWTSSFQTSCPSTSSHSISSPISSPRGTRCQSHLTSPTIHLSTLTPTTSSSTSQTFPATSARSPPWDSRCQSPMVIQNNQSSSISSIHSGRPSKISQNPPWSPTSQSLVVNQHTPRSTVTSTYTFQTPVTTTSFSSSWGLRCQSPMTSQNSFTAVSACPPKLNLTSSTTSPVSPPWGSRCQSPVVSQNSSTVMTVSKCRPNQTLAATSPVSPPWGSRCQSPLTSQNTSTVTSFSTSRTNQTSSTTSPVSLPWGSRSLSPAISASSLSLSSTRPLYKSTAPSPVHMSRNNSCLSPTPSNLDTKANHRLLAKNIINAAKRKNSPSPGALSSHNLPISPLGKSHHDYDCHKPPISLIQSQVSEAQSPTFTSPPPTPTQGICSPVRLYNTRSLTDSDASIESEDSGLRSPGSHPYNTSPRGWGSLRVKKSTVSTDL